MLLTYLHSLWLGSGAVAGAGDIGVARAARGRCVLHGAGQTGTPLRGESRRHLRRRRRDTPTEKQQEGKLPGSGSRQSAATSKLPRQPSHLKSNVSSHAMFLTGRLGWRFGAKIRARAIAYAFWPRLFFAFLRC